MTNLAITPLRTQAPLFDVGDLPSRSERRAAFRQQAAAFGCCQECADYDLSHAAPADSFEADAAAFAYDQARVWKERESRRQATVERDRVDKLTRDFLNGKRPARTFSVRKYRAERQQYEDGKVLLGRA